MTSGYQEFMNKAKHSAVRDLAWVLGSPNLLWAEDPTFSGRAVSDLWCREQFDRFLPHLIQLEASPDPLDTWIMTRPSKRLGRYFETLTAYWLHHGPGLRDVLQSLKVKNQDRTLGEFDFLVFDEHSGHSIHLEIAVKFYLRRGLGDRADHFTGPDGRDSLAHKLHTLFAKQTLLGESVEGQRALTAWRSVSLLVPKVMVKGYIFDPLKESEGVPREESRQGRVSYLLGSPNGLSEGRLRGWWVDRNHDSELWERFLAGRPDSLWSILPKLQWLSPNQGQRGTEILTSKVFIETLDHSFKSHPGAQLVTELRKNTEDNLYREVSRGFVVNTSLQ